MVEAIDPVIKICGIRDATVAVVAMAAGADAIGFMLAPSRRRIDPAAVTAILSAMPADRPLAVGVVVNESPSAIDEIVRMSGIDIVQLSGDEAPATLAEIELPVWKALRFPAGTTFDDASRMVESWLAAPRPAQAVLIDASVPGQYGGTGHVADWDLAALLALRYPVVLAGGLTPGNVAGAIGSVRPTGVDVSSGVEVDGAKDPVRIAAFIEASRAAFALAGGPHTNHPPGQ